MVAQGPIPIFPAVDDLVMWQAKATLATWREAMETAGRKIVSRYVSQTIGHRGLVKLRWGWRNGRVFDGVGG